MILDEIMAHKRAEVAERKAKTPAAELERRISASRAPRFAGALRAPGLSVIAEIKKASPSRGVIRANFDPASIACSYAHAGAAAISCLTDEKFFQGSLNDIAAAVKAGGLPVLRKDFLFDEYQLLEAAAVGAEAVLLIAAVLGDADLTRLRHRAADLGLDGLVEVHTAEEAKRALDGGATLIGINNRDLRDFTVDLRTTERILAAAGLDGPVVVSESGIENPQDVVYLRELGVDAILVGEALMRAQDPGEALRELMGWGK